MATITLTNPIPSETKNPTTYLKSAAAAGATSLSVANSSGFNTNRYLQVGPTGGEQTELVVLSATSSGTFTTAALAFGHAANTPLYEIKFNRFRIYRTRLGSTSLVAEIGIQIDSHYTVYTDAGTQTGDTYSVSFYDSLTGNETPTAGNVGMTGQASTTSYSLVDGAKRDFGDTQSRIAPEDWRRWLNELIRDLVRAAVRIDANFSLAGPNPTTDTSGTATADGTGTSFAISTSTQSYKWLFVSYDGSTFVRAYQDDLRNFEPTAHYASSRPRYSFIGSNVVVRPGNVAAIRYHDYQSAAEVDEDSDTLPLPLNFYPDMIRYGLLWKANETPYGTAERASQFQSQYERMKQEFLTEVADRQLMEVGHIEVTDGWWLVADEDAGGSLDYGRIN